MQRMQQIDPKGSFLKNLMLSLVLLGVSSFLIPIVLKQIDDQKAIDQEQFQESSRDKTRSSTRRPRCSTPWRRTSGNTSCTPPMW